MVTVTTQPRTGYAPVNGLEMYYEIHGSGQGPLVLLHGGALTIDLSFGAVLPALAAGHRVIAVELQGHGHTADIDRDPTIELLSGDVVALLDHLGIERADFFGFSLGGLVSLQTAIQYPDRVGRLVLASTHYRPDGYHEEILNYADHPDSKRMPTEEDFAAMQEAYARVAPSPDRFESTIAKFSDLVQSLPGWSADELRSITASTLLLIGDTDFVLPGHAVQMHELIAGSRLAILPDTTHTGLLKRADYVLPMLTDFLR